MDDQNQPNIITPHQGPAHTPGHIISPGGTPPTPDPAQRADGLSQPTTPNTPVIDVVQTPHATPQLSNPDPVTVANVPSSSQELTTDKHQNRSPLPIIISLTIVAIVIGGIIAFALFTHKAAAK